MARENNNENCKCISWNFEMEPSRFLSNGMIPFFAEFCSVQLYLIYLNILLFYIVDIAG